MALRALPEDSRVARPFVSAGKTGSPNPTPRWSVFLHALDLVGEVGKLAAVSAEELAPIMMEAPPAAPDALLEMLANTSSGTRNFASSGQP